MCRTTSISRGVFFVAWLLSLLGCEEENTPVNNFEVFWKDFDTHYAQFEHKGVDWDAVYETYRPRVTDKTGNKALFNILSEMAETLNDGHVEIYGGGRYYQSGIVGQTEEDDFELRIVKTNYIRKAKQAGEDNFTYGWLDEDIGYVHIHQMSGDNNDEWYKGIDSVLEFLNGAKGMVVDVRANFGGEDFDTYEILGRFADKKRATMKTRYRTGPEHDDLGRIKIWHIEPKGKRQFTGPIVLLTNIFSMSAAETFILAMRALPYVTQMGSTSAGACANTLNRELLNGWYYVVPIGYFTDPKGKCYEGIGFEPDPENQITNTEAQLNEGIDAVLEAAILRLSEQIDG